MLRFLSPRRAVLALAALCWIAGAHAAEAPLQLTVYNPGTDALFPVSSVIVSGQRDAILVDAQFGKGQAEQVVAKLKATGKHLTTVYISHGDPDYYFGLETVAKAFPHARIVASPPTVAHINKTMDAKLAYWGPQMGADQPQRLIVPEVLEGDRLMLEGQPLQVIGLDGPQPDRTVVWIPSIKAVVGGILVSENLHVWMADTQGAQSHADWLAGLKRIEDLRPTVVVPGHTLGKQSRSLDAVKFTAGYIRAFDQESARAADSALLIAAMQKRYPGLAEDSSLELGAKVEKGEMKW